MSPNAGAKAALDREAPFNDKQDDLMARALTADRQLLAIIQASLSLIGFGFTIAQIFSQAAARAGLAEPNPLARTVGIALLTLGIILLFGGLWARRNTQRHLQARRAWFVAQGERFVHGQEPSPQVMIVGALLLVVASVTLAAIVARLAD